MKRPPSEYYYDHIYGCFFDDPHGLKSLASVGENNVTFETDYPHSDSTWPHTKKVAEELMKDLTQEQVNKICRDNAIRMRAIGATSRAHIRTIYTISAFMAGVAGAILTQTTETVSLGVLDFQRSADILVILILGGTGRLYGGLIGAIIYMIARDWFSGVNPQYWYFPIGVLLIAVVLFLPNGILGGVAQFVNTERGQRWFGWLTSPPWFSKLWRRRA